MEEQERKFDRWGTHSPTSWAWRIFKKNNDELMRMYITMQTAHKYTYRCLKENGANWDSSMEEYFDFNLPYKYKKMDTLKEWSDSYNALENWVNLNALVTLVGNLETYIATIVPLALQSDFGARFGAPRLIDGIKIVKYSTTTSLDFKKEITDCTKGTWASRISAYKNLFGEIPEVIPDNEGTLEQIRNIRNEVAHSFGRDIETARHSEEIKVLPIRPLKMKKLLEYQDLIWKCAKAIDEHLYKTHIGEYQSLFFYHELYPKLNHNYPIYDRAMLFKKAIGGHGDVGAGKEFCKGLVKYYEEL